MAELKEIIVAKNKNERNINAGTPGAAHAPVQSVPIAAPQPFAIPYPLLWLAAAVLIVYFPTFSFGLTYYDDVIFISERHADLEKISSLFTSFHQGLYHATADPYYRPIFFDSMVINYLISGDGENIATYHVVNVLLHFVSVMLLYKLFVKLGVKELHSFLLCLLFAVHPVISQNVAWIPGRNDTILAAFSFSFLIYTINYARSGAARDLGIATACLLGALFTKEAGVINIVVAIFMLAYVLKADWLSKRNLVQYGIWVACAAVWVAARAVAIQGAKQLVSSQILPDFIHRLPVIVQYIGKIFLPFNLSVFPMQQDTVYYWGIAAIAILAAIIFLARDKNTRLAIGGAGIFLLYLLPVLLVPNAMSEQTFEHRLYLPLAGMLLLLSQTAIFKNNFTPKQVSIGVGIWAVLLTGINYAHQKNFESPEAFWRNAVKTSPHSATANKVMSQYETDPQQARMYMQRAMAINPNERMLNYYYGLMLVKEDSLAASEKYFLAEKRNNPNVYMCDLYLAQIAARRKSMDTAEAYLQDCLKYDSQNDMANQNLLHLYIMNNQQDKARQQVKTMEDAGLTVPPAAMRAMNGH